MASYDFDFQRYVERRKGAREAEAREGAAYAYGGDLRVLRTLDRLRPVKLALESTVRLWRSTARAELLGTSIKVTEKHFPRVHALARRAALALHIEPPAVFVSPQIAASAALHAYTFGTDDDAAVVLHAGVVDALPDGELLFVLGREFGHLQNHHVLYRTAQYFLVHQAGAFLRWVVRPAVLAIEAWGRRGDVTTDRAGLLAVRDLDAAERALRRLSAPPPVASAATTGDHPPPASPPAPAAPVDASPAAAADAPPIASAPAAPIEARSDLDRRIAILRVFADSAYYRGVRGETGGYPPEACDARVAEILSGAA